MRGQGTKVCKVPSDVNKAAKLRIAPTYLQFKLTLNLDDYRKKVSTKIARNKKGSLK
jgi:hypothetical protein